MPSSPLLLLWSRGPFPPASPDLPGLPPMPPRTHAAWRGLWRAGDRPGSSAGSRAQVGDRPPLLSHSSQRVPPTCFSDLPGLRGSDPVWPPLLLPLSPPTSYQFTWGLLPSPWGQASPPAAGRCPSCGKTLTQRLPTLPSLPMTVLIVLCSISPAGMQVLFSYTYSYNV